MTKRSQALSLNTVIIAAIVVLVLIILSFIVIRYMGEWSGDLENCALQQGKCAPPGISCGQQFTEVADFPVQRADLECGEGETCCVKLS